MNYDRRIRINHVSNVFPRQKKTYRYRKTANIVMFPGPRGLRWLRNLILWVAKKLRMLGHDVQEYQELGPIRYDSFDTWDLRDQIHRELLEVHKQFNLKPNEVEIIAGPEEYPNIRSIIYKDFSYLAPIDLRIAESAVDMNRDSINHYTTSYNTIKVSIIPWIRGFAVIPLKK